MSLIFNACIYNTSPFLFPQPKLRHWQQSGMPCLGRFSSRTGHSPTLRVRCTHWRSNWYQRLSSWRIPKNNSTMPYLDSATRCQINRDGRLRNYKLRFVFIIMKQVLWRTNVFKNAHSVGQSHCTSEESSTILRQLYCKGYGPSQDFWQINWRRRRIVTLI
jgi:hypothetical protein